MAQTHFLYCRLIAKMAGSGASMSMAAIAEEELATMHQFIENALDLKLKVRLLMRRYIHSSLSLPVCSAVDSGMMIGGFLVENRH